MNSSPYAHTHPLLGTHDAPAGYLIELSPEPATAEEIGSILESAQASGLDRRPWFVTAQTTASQWPEHVIPVFSQQAAPEEDARQLEASLRHAHRRLALRCDANLPLPKNGDWDYLLLSASQARSQTPFALQALASRSQLIGLDVHSYNDRDWLLKNACAMSTGEYLQTRAPQGKQADTTRQKLLQLLSLLAEDADTSELESIFRQEAKLSYSLLRLVNSAAIAPRTPITCFAQAINLLGRRQLERWLQLLVYADPNNGQHPTPLLYKAATRGRCMELLAPALQHDGDAGCIADSAFMVGCFSLLDALLNISMREILLQLPVSETVRQALAQRSGPLGELLRAIDASESRDLEAARQQLADLGMTGSQFVEAQLAAMVWTNRIRNG